MKDEYYVGQILNGRAELTAFANWAAVHTEAKLAARSLGNHTYEVYEVVPPVPTKDDIKRMRIEYRHAHIDDQTLERNRKMANGSWTEEDEVEYLALDAEVTAYIEENLPYPTDPIFEGEQDASSQD